MKYGIANISIIPMRVEGTDRAEMVNQILFGETYKVLEIKAKWVKIRLSHDSYEGWICKKQFSEINNDIYTQLSSKTNYYNYNLIDALSTEEGDMIPIGLGSSLPFYDGEHCLINDTIFLFEGANTPSEKHSKKNKKRDIIIELYDYFARESG